MLVLLSMTLNKPDPREKEKAKRVITIHEVYPLLQKEIETKGKGKTMTHPNLEESLHQEKLIDQFADFG